MSPRTLVAVAMLGGILCGCARGRTSGERDPWHRAPLAESPYGTWPELGRARIWEVIDARQTEAQGLLEAVPAMALAPEEAAEFIGRALPDAPGTIPYLVRGLRRNPGTGRFTVYLSGDQLAVHHGSLGSSASPTQRWALVLQLEREPAEVYVMTSVAK